jgi:hypothetical protein
MERFDANSALPPPTAHLAVLAADARTSKPAPRRQVSCSRSEELAPVRLMTLRTVETRRPLGPTCASAAASTSCASRLRACRCCFGRRRHAAPLSRRRTCRSESAHGRASLCPRATTAGAASAAPSPFDAVARPAGATSASGSGLLFKRWRVPLSSPRTMQRRPRTLSITRQRAQRHSMDALPTLGKHVPQASAGDLWLS